MAAQGTKQDMGSGSIPKLMLNLAIPAVVAQLINMLYNIVDRIYIGHIPDAGASALTGVGLFLPILMMINAFAMLAGSGGAPRAAIAMGKKDLESARKILGNCFSLLMIFSVMLTVLFYLFAPQLLRLFGASDVTLPYALSYARIYILGIVFVMIVMGLNPFITTQGFAKFSMLTTVVGAVCNIILDPILIFGLGMGVRGAAIATVLGQVFSFLLAAVYLWRFRSIRLERKHFAITLYESITIVTYGMSNSFNQVAITLVQIVLNNSLVYYGALSPYGREIPLAASGIVMKTNAILLAIIIGISQGTQPIIGFNYGAGRYRRARDTYWLAIRWNLVISAAGFVLFQFFPRQLLAFFGKGNELYYQFAVHFMRVFLLMVLVNGVQLLSSNFFAAIGKPLKGMFLSMTRQVLFLMPLLVALPLVFGLEGILYAGPAADLAAFLVTLGFIVREMQNIRRKEEALSAPTS